MALPRVTELIHSAVAQHYNGIAVARLERQLGKRKNSIQQWCDQDASIKLPPGHDTIYALADALRVDAGDLWLAFWRDAAEHNESPLYEVAQTPQAREGLSSQELAVLDRFNRTDPTKRHLILKVMDVFLPADQPPSPSVRSVEQETLDAAAHALAEEVGETETTTRPVFDSTREATTDHPNAVAS